MAYGRAGLAQGLAAGRGNIAAMLRDRRLTEAEEQRRQDELARRATERQEDIAREATRYAAETARREEDRQQMIAMQARPELFRQGGDIGPVPRESVGQVRPSVIPEPG